MPFTRLVETITLEALDKAVAVVTSAFVDAFVMLTSYPDTALPPSSITPSCTALPPVAVTAVQATVTLALPAVTVGAAIVSGNVDGVRDSEAADAALSPTFDPTFTVQVRATPLDNPVTVSGDEAPVALNVPQVAVY